MRGKVIVDKIGFIAGPTWDIHVQMEIEETHAGNARFELRTIYDRLNAKIPEVIMLQHGQEDWTSNNFDDQMKGVKEQPLRHYKTNTYMRIAERGQHRAKQLMAKIMSYLFKEPKICSLEREKAEWLDGLSN